jgi:hypothetical protein
VFPREPRNRKRAQKGNLSKIQTLYYEKDIRFLLHEPIVWKFRDFKAGLEKTRLKKKNQPSGVFGFFWFFLGFLGFFGFFGFFLGFIYILAQKRKFLGVLQFQESF